MKGRVQKRTEVNAGFPAAGHPRGYSAFLFSHFCSQEPSSILNYEQPEVGRFKSGGRNFGLPILELAMGASGPTTLASFSVLKA